MRFNSEAYERAFPRQTPKVEVETVVETFRPTKSESVEEDELENDEIEEANDGDGSDSESTS